MKRAATFTRLKGLFTGRRWTIGVVLGVALALANGPGSAVGQEAQPGAAAKAAPLAGYVPRNDLISYLEFDGLDAHQAAWRASAAYKLLNDTSLGALLEDLASQYIELNLRNRNAPPGWPKAADLIAAIKQTARQGFVFGTWSKGADHLDMVLVLRGGDRPDLHRILEVAPRLGEKPVEKAGRDIHAFGGDSFWWVEKGDLVFSSDPDVVLAVLDGKGPSSVDHPLRTALAKAEGGFQPAAVGFLDFAKLPMTSANQVRLGLDGVKQIEFTWGFEGDALRTVLRALVPAPRRGLLALMDQPGFDAGSLPPLPVGSTGFTVLSIDLARTYDQVSEMLKQADPNGPDRVAMAEDAIRQQFGFDLRKDLIAGLGPKLIVSTQAPAEGAKAGAGAKVNRSARLITRLSGFTISAQVRDPAAVSRAIEPLMTIANLILQNGPMRNAARAPLEFRKQESARPAYVLDLPAGLLPPPLASLFRPTIVLGKDQLVIGASTAAAEAVANLADAPADRRWKPSEAFVPVMSKLPAKMVYLRITDPRETLPAIIDALPILAQQVNAEVARTQQMRDARFRRVPKGAPAPPQAAPATTALRIDANKLPQADALIQRLFPASTALVVDSQGATLIAREPIPGLTSPAVGGFLLASLVPAAQAARGAAKRAQCVNNLKQIALADHNHHSATNAFPAQAIVDKDGKPLLSWRVAILPYIEQQELYNKFKLDEPWDSPNNKPLIKQMPATYLCPDRRNPEPGTTTYRVFLGPAALFEEGVGTPIQNITDGTSNTIMVVEAKDAVPWTKPDDLKFDAAAKPSLYGAGSTHAGGFNAAFADGSVRFLKNAIDVQVMKALITRASGEVVSSDSY